MRLNLQIEKLEDQLAFYASGSRYKSNSENRILRVCNVFAAIKRTINRKLETRVKALKDWPLINTKFT